MSTVILAVYVLIAIALIGLILIQHGKGADAGATFGGGAGASDTVFGSQGSGNFLTKTTAILATSFFAIALFLSYLSGQSIKKEAAPIIPAVTTPAEKQKIDVPVIPDLPGTTPAADAGKAGADVPAVPVTVQPGTVTTDSRENTNTMPEESAKPE